MARVRQHLVISDVFAQHLEESLVSAFAHPNARKRGVKHRPGRKKSPEYNSRFEKQKRAARKSGYRDRAIEVMCYEDTSGQDAENSSTVIIQAFSMWHFSELHPQKLAVHD